MTGSAEDWRSSLAPSRYRDARASLVVGDEVRRVLAGIALAYAPEDLMGRKVVVVTNLAPRKMRGLESNGMLLAASAGPDGKPVLCTFAEDIAPGAKVK